MIKKWIGHIPLWLLAFSVLPLAVKANDIALYKSSATFSWSQYECFRPAGTPIPKNARVGTYTETSYLVYDSTTQQAVSVSYWSYLRGSVLVKEYSTAQVEDLGAVIGNRAERFIKSSAVNTWFHCLSYGGQFEDTTTDSDGDGTLDYYYQTEESNMVGTAKPYTVVAAVGVTPAIIIPRLATTLTGNTVYSFEDVLSSSDPNLPHKTTLYFESGPEKLTLDVANTKKAHTGLPLTSLDGSAVYLKGTLDYGVRVAQLALEALGYDSVDPIPVTP